MVPAPPEPKDVPVWVEGRESDGPPEAHELLVFPDKVKGYNLRLKIWGKVIPVDFVQKWASTKSPITEDLQVDSMHEVKWDKKAFDHLVIADEYKDLIEALVTTKIDAEQGTDLIQGKGQGLIILLHGGPGTGKTFTAESVAEFAEKPLFRVTCGDIGSKPEEVEKYLESMLHLGKIWDCIVLLDEADVFLEQRALADLDRNALVSVFLRVLEYYEGILILTSNRVGTFDEAFTSRIQLSLHYKALNETQRREVWKNFFDRLKRLELEKQQRADVVGPLSPSRKRKFEEETLGAMGIDFENINCYLTELAKREMNGRQIRNTITTARKVANCRKTRMTYAHLKQVMDVSKEFDEYLRNVRGGFETDELARGDGIR
jgi:SpoVK/Ycf46/Vps4 family AAA+-type ATPase